MDSEDDSRSSNSGSSSSSNGPSSPPPQLNENESNDQIEQTNDIERRSRSSSQDSNSLQEKEDSVHDENQSMSPIQQKVHNDEQSKGGDDDEEELELSDIDEESNKQKKADISHEDLSDISDLESSNDSPAENFTDLRQKLDKQRQNGSSIEAEVKNDEDELDFEADEIKEVPESVKKPAEPKKADSGNGSVQEDGEHNSEKELESGEELEEGEVTDGDEKRPEESEPKAVCRFFTRGQCTWGMSCRFLHPGTTDKGNYTMFDLVRPIPVPQPGPMMMPSYDYRNERPPIHHIPPHAFGHGRVPPAVAAPDSESAWERGLRTAKEMMRKASKRKEQDMDFDEKKMNLSGPPDEIEKDPYYVRASPDVSPPSFERGVGGGRGPPPPRGGPPYPDYSPPAKFSRAGAPFYEEDQYGRMARSYRELPPHRMPHYEDEEIGKRRMVRATREVIVEKASDEWNDPWMRKSPGRTSGKERKGRGGRERSYSSNSSYSSSSSSRSSHTSSESSPSPSRRRFDVKHPKERIITRKVERPKSRSNSLKRRHSPIRQRAPAKKAISPAPIPKRKKPNPSPGRGDKVPRKKRDNNNSSSGSTSGSESDSSYSSSTSSSKGKKKREKIVSERKPAAVAAAAAKKVEMTKKRTTPPQATKEDEKEKSSEKASAAAKMKSSRREELLKQLRAVEDAIARKRSKIN